MELHVREIREKLGMSQDKFSKETCIARSYLQKLEDPYSNANPSACLLCRLARQLNIPVGELFDCDPPEKRKGEEKEE